MKEPPQSKFQFVHTADIHLDSPMKGLTQYEGVAVDRLRTATRDAFSELISKTIDSRPAFVIIAGDLFDGDWKDYNTGYSLVTEMSRLRMAEIRAYVLYGNHDAQSQITKRLRLPENVHEFSHKEVESHRLDDLNVVLHGRSYPRRDVQENLVQEYPSPIDGMFNIGVLHTGLGGLGGHANYAPCSLEQLVNAGYDYWALGHVHTRQILNEYPHVVFPGNLQGRHINEDGPRSASLITVEDGRVVDIEEWECDFVRWHRIEVPVEDCAEFSEVITAIGEKIDEFQDEKAEDHTNAVRIRLTGTTSLHGLLVSANEDLTLDVQAMALDRGGDMLWVEKVENATKSAATSARNVAKDEAIGELQSMLDGAIKDHELAQQIQEEFATLLAKLHSELKTDLEDSERGYTNLLVNDKYEELLEQTADRVMFEITRGEQNAD